MRRSVSCVVKDPGEKGSMTICAVCLSAREMSSMQFQDMRFSFPFTIFNIVTIKYCQIDFYVHRLLCTGTF